MQFGHRKTDLNFNLFELPGWKSTRLPCGSSPNQHRNEQLKTDKKQMKTYKKEARKAKHHALWRKINQKQHKRARARSLTHSTYEGRKMNWNQRPSNKWIWSGFVFSSHLFGYLCCANARCGWAASMEPIYPYSFALMHATRWFSLWTELMRITAADILHTETLKVLILSANARYLGECFLLREEIMHEYARLSVRAASVSVELAYAVDAKVNTVEKETGREENDMSCLWSETNSKQQYEQKHKRQGLDSVWNSL